MSVIKVLPESLSNKIAAGEVVERPASVVKELVENAIDADATQITVQVGRGGLSLIRVSDNGTGMTRDDALLSLERYAPNFDTYAKRLEQAHGLRKSFLTKDTDAFRLVNGEGDLLPGLICDVYGRVAVLQFDGTGPREFAWPSGFERGGSCSASHRRISPGVCARGPYCRA